MWFAIYEKSDNEAILCEMIERFTIVQAKKYVENEYGDGYHCVPAPGYDPLKEFDYEGLDFGFERDGEPSKKQLTNAEDDSQYEQRRLRMATKCVDCGVQVPYKTRPYRRCVECKRKFERERKRLARSKK